MRTSNQHTPKQTGQQGFSLVETLLCENIKPACKLKICLRATFLLSFVETMRDGVTGNKFSPFFNFQVTAK